MYNYTTLNTWISIWPFGKAFFLRLLNSVQFHLLTAPPPKTNSRFVASSFKLPGEAQKIGRVMQAFAKRFYTANPGSVFKDEGKFSLIDTKQI
mgnify:CR=1 FL=1